MCAISLESLVKKYIIENPKASPEQLRQYVQDKTTKYDSVKVQDYRKAMRLIDSREVSQAVVASNNPAIVTTKAEQAIEEAKKEKARAAATRAQKAAAEPPAPVAAEVTTPTVQKAPVTEPTKVSTPRANNKAARQAALVEGMVDKEQQGFSSLQEALKGSNPEERVKLRDEMRQVQEPEKYTSQKKAKHLRKTKNAEANSTRKHLYTRKSRAARNAEYCTQNGIISSESKGAKEALENAKHLEEVSKNRKYNIVEPENLAEKRAQWQKVFEERWGQGNVEIGGNPKPKAPKMPTLPAVIEKGASTGAGAGAAVESGAEAAGNAARRIGKKGWIGIAIATVASLTGLVIHHKNKKKAENLNVNA